MSLLEVKDLKKYYPVKKSFFFSRREYVKAVDSISFEIRKGETVGLVGESGCGKSTLAKLIVKLEQPTEGQIKIYNQDITDLKGKQRKNFCKKYQMIFQDPYSSLNPKKKIYNILDEILFLHTSMSRKERYDRIRYLIEMVGLNHKHLDRFPYQFSGGQRQRIGIARALAVEPEIIIADEPVSALDVSIQAQIINLLIEIQKKTNISYLFISHDLAVVENICDRIMVMYLGEIVEVASTEELINHPEHPYTKELLSAVPGIEIEKKKKEYIPLNNIDLVHCSPGQGCKFLPRCPVKTDGCKNACPALEPIAGADLSHLCACTIANMKQNNGIKP